MPSQNLYFITEADLNRLKNWFTQYVHSFYSSDPFIQQAVLLKENHSLRVCHEILLIGKQLALNANQMMLAEAIALLHDIGRFEQITRHRTFVDAKSENHAQLGVKVLRREGPLAILAEETQALILSAICHHNRMSIPEDETPACIFFTKMIRDADKLDIFNLFTEYYNAPPENRSSAVELDLPDIPVISDEVVAAVREGKMVPLRQLQSLNDFKLLQLAWIYDINFQPTFQMIQERDYLGKIWNTLPPSKKIYPIYGPLFHHLRASCGFQAAAQSMPA